MGTTPETAVAKLAYVRIADGTLYRIGAPGPAGPAGAAGTSILSGTTTPDAGTGAAGDYYVDTDTHILYGPKTGSTWPVAVAQPLILNAADSIPAGTPAGTIILRRPT